MEDMKTEKTWKFKDEQQDLINVNDTQTSCPIPFDLPNELLQWARKPGGDIPLSQT